MGRKYLLKLMKLVPDFVRSNKARNKYHEHFKWLQIKQHHTLKA